MLVKRYYILYFYLLSFYNLSFTDTISSVMQINTAENQLSAPPFVCFNTQTEQFMVSFLANNSYCSLYDTAGNLVTGPTMILNADNNPIAFSSPIGCYNSITNQYLISYLGWHGDTSTYFSILDQSLNTLAGPVELVNPDGDINSKVIYCCYNSRNNQYLIVWSTGCFNAYFVILDASGNIVVDRTEISGVCIGDGRCLYVSYNSTDNQYFFTWQDIDTGCPCFAIYDALGSVIVAPTVIEDAFPAYSTFIASAYNSTDNQYMIVWSDTGNNGYFAIYDATGSVVVVPTLIVEGLVGITGGGGIAICYNPANNEYFLSWNGNDTKSYYTIYSNQGVQKILIESVINPGNNLYYSVLKSNACASTKNIYWFGWQSVATDHTAKGYFDLYTREKNISAKLTTSQFAKGVQYFNSLPWNASKNINIAGLSNVKLLTGKFTL